MFNNNLSVHVALKKINVCIIFNLNVLYSDDVTKTVQARKYNINQ